MTIKEIKSKIIYDPVKGWFLPELKTRGDYEGGSNVYFKGTLKEESITHFYKGIK